MASKDRKGVERVFGALKSLNPELSLPLLLTLITIARRSGLSVNDLADELDIPQQTASRYVSVLQGRYQVLGRAENTFAKAPLLTLGISTDDSRSRALFLTEAGETEVKEFLKKLSLK